MKEFLAMGGYAAYVWTAYGITAFVIAANVWLAERRFRRTLDGLKTQATGAEAVRQPTVRKLT